MDIAKLVARLELQSSQFQTELEKTNKKLLGFQRQSNSSLKSIENSFRSFYTVLKVGFAGIGIGALSGIAKNAITAGDELNKAAIKAGTTGKAMSELAYAAKQSDIELTDLSTSLRFMQKNLSEAAQGSKSQVDTFKQLGVSLESLKRLAPDRQFELLADRINGVKDPADRARLATELFGRAGANLLPLFEKGAQGIRMAREEAQKLGVSMSDDQIKKLAEADDAIKRLKQSWEGFARTLTASVAPALATVFDYFSGASGKSESVESLEIRLKSIENGYDEVAKAALRAQIAIAKEQALGGRFSGPTQRSTTGSSAPSVPSGRQIPGVFLESVTTTAKRFKEFQADLRDKEALDQYIRNLQDVHEAQTTLFEAADAGIEDGIKASLETIGNDLDNLAIKTEETSDTMSEFAKSAAQNMQSHFADFLFDPLKDGFKGMLKGFVDTIRRMAAEAAAAKVFESLFGNSGGSGILGTALSAIFGGAKAAGGPVMTGKSYLVGERGPELFTPGSSGSITPNNQLGGPVVNVVTHIDARGATSELANALPAIMKQNNDALESKIVDGLRRKRYGI